MRILTAIHSFARASFNYAIMRGWPLYFSTKNTILKAHDGYFLDIFATIYQNEFKAEFDKRGLTYEHRLIDDMVACALKWNGAYVWHARTTTATCSRTRWRGASALWA